MPEDQDRSHRITRRDFLKAGLVGGGATAVAASLPQSGASLRPQVQATPGPDPHHPGDHEGMGVVGEVDHARNGFDPHQLLQDWDFGEVSTLASGQTLRQYRIVAVDKEIEVAPGIVFPGVGL